MKNDTPNILKPLIFYFHSRKKYRLGKVVALVLHLLATIVKGRCISMEVINSNESFEPNIEVWEEGFKPLPKKETEKSHSDIYEEPMYFFKGTVINKG